MKVSLRLFSVVSTFKMLMAFGFGLPDRIRSSGYTWIVRRWCWGWPAAMACR
jgi:hypothetical protein